MSISSHLVDKRADRALGKVWERNFCNLARKVGRYYTHNQISDTVAALFYCVRCKREHSLPDVTIWDKVTEHHEVKHKNPTDDGCYGFEAYRIDPLVDLSLQTGHDVFLTIHNWEKAGGKFTEENSIDHWVCANVRDLINSSTGQGMTRSYRASGEPFVLCYYWDIDEYFIPLAQLWGIDTT